MTSYKEAYKYPFIVSEILSSKNRLIEKSLLNDTDEEEQNNILNLIKVLDNKEVLNSTLPGYINKIITSHIDNELLYNNVLKNNTIIFNILMKYIYNDSYRDLYILIINEAVKKGKKEYYDIVPKLFDNLLNNMNQYISVMNSNSNDKGDNLNEIKDGINNIIYILVKLAENSEDLFKLIIKKLAEGELPKNLKNNIKEIEEDEEEEEEDEGNNNIKNKQNVNAFCCIYKLSILFSNLFNIVITKNENDKYSFKKYFLSTIFDVPYTPYNYVPSYIANNNKENNDKENEIEENNKKKEYEENIKLLIDTSLSFLKEIYSIFENRIETIDELNKSIIFSFYNKVTDIIILITVIEKKDNEKLNIFLNDILIDLIQLIIDYPLLSLIHNKILKIFQFIIEYNLSIKKDKIIIYLNNYFNEKKNK